MHTLQARILVRPSLPSLAVNVTVIFASWDFEASFVVLRFLHFCVPLDIKNAYSNYDDHCTVVVAIEYAFFKGGPGGVAVSFWGHGQACNA